MKYDKHKAFPYPVLRPGSDDYHDGEFQTTVEFLISGSNIKASIKFALSSDEIREEISKGNAEYICIISCRDTYVQKMISSTQMNVETEFDIGSLRGEVRVDPYVVVTKEISDFSSIDINREFGDGPFKFQVGDLLAQDETQIFFIDRDLFKPVTSVFDLVKKDSLLDGMWTINFNEDHIQIEVSPKLKESIDDARNDIKNRVILKNSIYFAAVMQAIQKLQDPEENFEGRKWANVISKQAHNKGFDINGYDAYLLAEHLMQYPISQLESKVFKGVVS